MKNNMLIKNEDIGIFRKILNFFKNIFHKKEKNEKYNTKLQENNIIKEFEQKRKITELQKNYETNIIREEDLTEKEKENLLKLYRDQIDAIENNIKAGLKELEFYKQKISKSLIQK